MKNKLKIIFLLMSIYACKNNENHIPPQVENPLSLDSLSTFANNLPTTVFTDLTFTDGNTGYAISQNLVAKTTNGGSNWSRKVVPMNLMKKIQFTDPNTGYIIGENEGQGYVLITKDAGNTWKPVKLDIEMVPTGMHFINNEIGFITGQNLFVKTIDGGLTWKNIKPNEKDSFIDVNFRNSKEGFATSINGIYLKTIDGGQTWENVQTPYPITLNEIYFAGNQTLVAVSSDKLMDLTNNFNIVNKPQSSHKLLYINAKQSVGIGSHYDQGFWPYGDVFLTNNGWSDFKQKTFPTNDAISFNAIAKMTENKIMIIGLGFSGTKVLIFSL